MIVLTRSADADSVTSLRLRRSVELSSGDEDDTKPEDDGASNAQGSSSHLQARPPPSTSSSSRARTISIDPPPSNKRSRSPSPASPPKPADLVRLPSVTGPEKKVCAGCCTCEGGGAEGRLSIWTMIPQVEMTEGQQEALGETMKALEGLSTPE